MAKTAKNRRAMPAEMLVFLVISLVVMAVIVLFVKGGFSDIGKKFGLVSGDVKGNTGDVTGQMDIGKMPDYKSPLTCDTSKSSTDCKAIGGECAKDWPACTAMGGDKSPGPYDCFGSWFCCCAKIV